MSQDIVVFLLSAFFILLVSINGFLYWRLGRVHKKLDELLEKGKVKEFKDIFLSQKARNDDLQKQVESAFLKIKNLEDVSQIAVQKVGIVRFNPFNELGGDQSFVAAMLDAKQNGFVLSSFFIKEGNRVYAKTIKNGKSDNPLLKEEVEAINKAIKNG